MNRDEIFAAWKKRKEHIEVHRDFSADVMRRIRRSRPASSMPDRVRIALKQIAVRPWAKAAAIVLGISLGLARIFLTLQLILFA